MTTIDKTSIIICDIYIPYERKGYMANESKTNMLTITEDNAFLKLKFNLLKHDHFTCKLAQIPNHNAKFCSTKIEISKRKIIIID